MNHLISLTLLGLCAVVPVAAQAASAQAAGSARCDGMIVTVLGTEGRDRLLGTPGRDVISGLGGADRIEGLGGADTICGGEGDDRIAGGAGPDRLQGNAGDDRVLGGTQSSLAGDALNGGNGDDVLVPGRDGAAGHAADRLAWTGATRGIVVDLVNGSATGQGSDTIELVDDVHVTLTGFDDALTGSRWRDEVLPGHGHDRIVTGSGRDTVTFPSGADPSADPDDVVNLGGGDDVLRHGDGDLTAYAGPGDDLVIERGAGVDRVHGGAGGDQIRTRLADVPGQEVRGDRGRDTLTVVRGSAMGLDWDMATGAALVGEPGVAAVLGGFEAGVLDHGDGTATVTGTAGEDRIDARVTTSFTARGGRDRFVGSTGQDAFDGGSGRDTYESDRGGAPNTCTAVEADPQGACAVERAASASRTSGREPARAAATCRGERATIVGTQRRDRLVGTPRRDVIAGLRGDDLLVGAAGNDLLCGGRGSDGLLGGPGDDRLGTGPGARDVVSWDDADRAVHVDLLRGTARGEGRDRVTLGAGVVHLTAYDDTFIGTAYPEEVHAGDGDDTLRSGSGDDVLHLDTDESTGDDSAVAGPGDDQVRSLGGRDRMLGKAGRDYLGALSGNTVPHLRGGTGRDVVETLLPANVADVAQVVTGGADRDRILVAVWPEGLHTWDLATGVLQLDADTSAHVAGFERHVLVNGLWTVSGTDGPDDVTALVGATFAGLGGDDRYAGSPGDDAFDGGPGDDTYLRDPGGTNTCTSVEHDPEAVCTTP